jgi:hypothetical protein
MMYICLGLLICYVVVTVFINLLAIWWHLCLMTLLLILNGIHCYLVLLKYLLFVLCCWCCYLFVTDWPVFILNVIDIDIYSFDICVYCIGQCLPLLLWREAWEIWPLVTVNAVLTVYSVHKIMIFGDIIDVLAVTIWLLLMALTLLLLHLLFIRWWCWPWYWGVMLFNVVHSVGVWCITLFDRILTVEVNIQYSYSFGIVILMCCYCYCYCVMTDAFITIFGILFGSIVDVCCCLYSMLFVYICCCYSIVVDLWFVILLFIHSLLFVGIDDPINVWR